MAGVGLVTGINYFLALLDESIRQFRLGRVWLLLVGYFAILWLVLLAHYRFYSPAFFGLIEPWLQFFDKQQAAAFIHYPGHLVNLPYFFGWARLILSIPIEGAILGAMSVLFYESYVGRRLFPAASLRQLLFVWLQVTIAWLVINGLVLLVSDWLPKVLEPTLQDAAFLALIFKYLFQPFLYFLIYSLFFFSIPYIAIYRSNALRGIWYSATIFLRNPITCFCLGAAVFILPVIVSIMARNSGALIHSFTPEAVYWLIVIGLAISLLTHFFWTAIATRFLIDLE